MMKVKTAVRLAALAFFALLASCQSKDMVKTHDEQNQPNSITFSIKAPDGAPVNYTRAAIHDADEWTVNALTLYQFSADENKLMEIVNIDMAKVTKTNDAEYTYTKEFDINEAGPYRFVFVANDQVQGASVGMTLTDFKTQLMTQKLKSDGSSTSKDLLTTNAGKQYIPMTGVAKLAGSESLDVMCYAAPIKVELTRVVARIDLYNHIPNFTIKELSLENTSDKTYTFPTEASGSTTYEAPTDATRVGQSAGFAEIPASGVVGIAGKDGAPIHKAFYLYEGKQPQDNEANATTIVVKGTYTHRGVTSEKTYRIPFKQDQLAYQPIDIKRNYLYRVHLGDNTPITPDTKVKFSIEVLDWNRVVLEEQLKLFTITCTNANTKDFKYDIKTRTATTNQKKLQLVFDLGTLYQNGHYPGVSFRVNKTQAPGCITITHTYSRNSNIFYVYIDLLKNPNGRVENGVKGPFDKKTTTVFDVWHSGITPTDRKGNPTDKSLIRQLTIVYDPNWTNPDFN